MTVEEAVAFAYWDAKKQGALEHEAIEKGLIAMEGRGVNVDMPYAMVLRIVDSVSPPGIDMIRHADKKQVAIAAD